MKNDLVLKNYLVRMETRGFFNKCNLCLADNMDQLRMGLPLAKDQGLMTDLSGRVLEISTATTILAPVV